MPSAKRRFDKGPVSRDIYDRHNRHKHETWHDVKAVQAREQRRPKRVPLYGDPTIGYAVYEEV